MKKVLFLLTFFVCALGVQAKMVYLDANIWDVDGPSYFVHSWGSGDHDTHMQWITDKVYGADIPDGDTWVLFLRMRSGLETMDWAQEWNRTNDLMLGEWGNCFRINCWDCADGGKSGGEWHNYPDKPVVTEFYLAGEGFPGASWDAGSHLKMTDNMISFTGLAAGTYRFKVTNNSWDYALGFESLDASCSTKGYSRDGNGNVVINLLSSGDITIKVVNAKICLTIVGEVEESFASAVPSQCTDVLMQGFYYDSYEVDTAHAGTVTYGDTKWKTLLPQAGEIGAYFDLIWLPPSGYASGVGYHPKQYSNQNSDWGSRTDLEKLIAAFHNSGTKVVADIVINHVEAMASWCDFAVQDFGEYGKFVIDGSYICQNDEMNQPYTKVDTLAGECWGTATGPNDDGENWDAARDWAHDSPKVQELFKAYLKWMKKVMHYDGWRYDKGDGFSNWHMDNYNKASEPYIAFKEHWKGVGDIKKGIEDANMNMMALDFQTKYSAIDAIAGWNYIGRGDGLMSDDYWKRHAVTWVDNHDMFLRSDAHGQEFGGYKQSMTEDLKFRLLNANALILSMPGVPCIFYPHWHKYKEYIKPMIDARHLAGVHSESEVKDQQWDWDASQNRNKGYQATIVGKNGYLILCLGTKADKKGFGPEYKLIASGYNTSKYGPNESYEMWVNATSDVAPSLIVTPDAAFEDNEKGIDVTIKAVGPNSDKAVIYFTTDGTDPTTASNVYTGPLNFKQTTVLKVMAVSGTAQSGVQTYTYTYREPLQRGIRVRFKKPDEWNKAYIYAWKPYKDEEGQDASENIMGAYPGQRLYQDVDGWFGYEFDADMDSVNFCINSGDECGGINVRSNNLVTDYDVCYGWRDGKETDSNEEEVLDCETDLHPNFDIVISPESGFFGHQTPTQTIRISTVGVENAMVYYTLDGTEPTTSSLYGQSPIELTVSQTTTVKAYAVHEKERTLTRTETYTHKDPQSGPLVVRFQKPETWENLYLYAFTRVVKGSKYIDTPYSLDGKSPAWPGMKWETMDGNWYIHTMKPEIKEIYIIFTEGRNKPQTQDIFLDENTCYLWNPDCGKAVIDSDCNGIWEEGIEEVIDNSQKNHETYKFIIDNRLVIIHNGIMYDVLGRRL